MAKKTVSQILATNLAEAMRAKKLTQLALAVASGVPQTTISLMLRPAARAATHGKALPSPTLERIALLASALNVEPWQLLHPDPDQAKRETEFYDRIRHSFDQLPQKPKVGA